MSKSSVSNNRKNARDIVVAKHVSIQTAETDPTHDNRNKTIVAAFQRQVANKLNRRKNSSAKTSMQALVVRPRFESTPVKTADIIENSDTDCEILIDDVTPIRVGCKSSKSLIEGSHSQKEHLYRMYKSDGNVLSGISNSQSTRKMLSLDETVFNSLDLESFDAKLLDVVKEAPLPVTSSPNKTGYQCAKEVLLEVSKANNVIAVSPRVVRNERENEILYMSPPPPPAPVEKGRSKTLKFLRGTQNACTTTADVHSHDLSCINIDNWVNDSFMDSVLNRSNNNIEALSLSSGSNDISVLKRPIHCDDKSPVLNKRLKDINTLAGGSREKYQNVSGAVNKDPGQTVEQNHSSSKSYASGDKVSFIQNQQLSKNSEEIEKTKETTYKIQSLYSREDELQQYHDSMDEKENSVGKKNSSNLSVGEKMRRMLVTNALKPVTSRLKSLDVFPSPAIPKPTESFCELGPFFGLPSGVKTLFETLKGISTLYEWQEECLNLNAVKEKKNLVYALPTSGGKTLVAEILLLRELLCCQKNALFVLPYVAIVQEKVHSLSPFAVDHGFLVEEYAAGKGQYPPRKHRSKLSIYVATIEKAFSLINSLIEAKRLSEIGLVIVDELHLLGEGDRGATLECLLTRLLFSSERIHIVGMSATIGNLEEVAAFLHAEVYLSNFRPVELKEYVKCEDTLWAVNNKEEELLTKVRAIEPPYDADMIKLDPDKVCSLVLEVVPEFSCLVFCPTKSNCENVAALLIRIMPRELVNVRTEERKALLKSLLNEGRGKVCPTLQKCVPYGVAYHHSGLTGDERRLLEEAYRIGTLCCICCTSTLAAGVNLPAKRVILRAPFVGAKFISRSQYKQMVGRAGRAGFDVTGESILVCQKRDMQQVTTLLTSQIEGANSRIHISESRGLQSLVLSSIGLGIATCRKDMHKMVNCTLLHVQRNKLEVNPKQLIDKSISKLFKLGGLKVDSVANSLDVSLRSNISGGSEQVDQTLNITHPTCNNSNAAESGDKSKIKHLEISRGMRLKISRLGRAAMKGPIDLCRANELYKDLLQAQASMVLLSHLHLLYLVTPYDMMDQIKVDSDVYFHVYSDLNSKDMQTANIIGITQACMLKVLKGSKSCKIPERVVHRFYVTLILNDLWNHCNVWEVSRKYNITRGVVQTLMTSSASFASSVLHFCEELNEFWAFKQLLGVFAQRLSHCCSADLAPLMELPAVKMGRARQLYNAGYKTLLDVANADPSLLVSSIDHMPWKTAKQIKSAAKMLLLVKVDNLRDELQDIVEKLAVEP